MGVPAGGRSVLGGGRGVLAGGGRVLGGGTRPPLSGGGGSASAAARLIKMSVETTFNCISFFCCDIDYWDCLNEESR